ncbi:hypothetical protein RB595_000042 [Gaeumannomyces hyphopodioides]
MDQPGFSCPQGGRFYVCQNNETEFIGCCTVNPCIQGNGVCPKSNLTQTSFSADALENIPPQNCSDQQGHHAWWTCKGSTLPFVGCCSKNPCPSGFCSANDLLPARLSDNKTKASIFLSAQSIVLPSATGSSSNLPLAPVEAVPPHGLHPGAIAGIVVGAVFLISGLVLLWKKVQGSKKSRKCSIFIFKKFQ